LKNAPSSFFFQDVLIAFSVRENAVFQEMKKYGHAGLPTSLHHPKCFNTLHHS
jgi:hypothetical protein